MRGWLLSAFVRIGVAGMVAGIVLLSWVAGTSVATVKAGSAGNYVPPESRTVYNLNVDWKFFKGHVPGAEAVDFDDSAWETVSVPHTFNDVDTFDDWITNGGDSVWRGIVWYRKKFKLPEERAGQKVFLEFEGIRQAAYVYVNGAFVGRYEAGVTPFGFDISEHVHFGDTVNVVAVMNDSRNVAETGSNTRFQWDHQPFNPVFGGLTRNVKLHVMGSTFFTLPLYSNLRTHGTYIYPSEISTERRTARIHVEPEVRNESGAARRVAAEAVVVDMDGKAVFTLAGEPVTLEPGATHVFELDGVMTGVYFWQPGYPYLYTVYCILKEGEEVLDVYEITTGFRKVEFLGGWNEGGVYINNQHFYLTGYAQRSTNEWPLLGAALPQWVTDYDGQLIVESNANFIRWMHIAPTPASVRMTDKYGIAAVAPAGDSEKDVQGRQWEQRVEAMRDTIIYFRNNPSVLFWEAGNNTISPEHMRVMRALKERLDPHGMRAIGARGLAAPAAIDEAEYVATMLNRHYTDYARERVPVVESEYMRDEAPRRVWDDASPPDFGYKHHPSSTWTYTSEEFAVMSAVHFHEYYKDRIQGSESSREMYSGQAALIWADSNQHGRNYLTETARVSGRVDALRIPKESYYAFQVLQSPVPDLHIVGHWTYPEGTPKDVYVLANHIEAVELFVNGVSKGKVTNPTTYVDKKRGATYETPYVFTFPNIAWEPGVIKAVGYDADGNVVREEQKETAGPPAAIRLTPIVGPDGWYADGSDVVIVEVEVVDAQGRRVPTDQARIDFTYQGEGRFLGGYNVGRRSSTFKDSIETEAGVNRVIIRSTRTPGAFTLTASREGLEPATITLISRPFELTDGLTTAVPAAARPSLPTGPPEYGPDVRPPRPLKPVLLSSGKPATASGEEAGRSNFAANANDGNPNTRWAANNGDPGHWWKVDLQGVYELTGTQVTWYRENTYYQYMIEVSLDDRNWTLVADRRENAERLQTMSDEFRATARFVRITVTGTEAGWASMYEFQVFGAGGSGLNEWKPPSVSASYDFGPAESPLEAGFVRVSEATEYTPVWQFGFVDPARVRSVDRAPAGGHFAGDLLRDFIVGEGAVFRVELKPGDFGVTITAGDPLEANRTELAIEGERVRPLTSQAGAYDQESYKVRLEDGELEIEFMGRINAVEILPLPPQPKGLALFSRDSEELLIGWDPVYGAMGYKVYRAEANSGDFRLVGESGEPLFQDQLAPGLDRVVYQVTTIMEMGEITLVGESFPSEPFAIDLERPEPNWKEAFFVASSYFSTTDPTPHPPVLQLVPELPEGLRLDELVWSSSRPEVAEVDAFGIVTAKAPGVADIAAATGDGRFRATTRVYAPAISESFENQRPGDSWGAQTGTAGGSGNLGGAIASLGGNNVFQMTGGGTGVRSTQKRFPEPVKGEWVRFAFDWNVGAPKSNQGAQLSVEDSTGRRYLTLQYRSGQEIVYATGGAAANQPVEGLPLGSGFDQDGATYHVTVDLDFSNRSIDLRMSKADDPGVEAEILGIPFASSTPYTRDVGKIQFVLLRSSGETTAWTTWIDNLNIYAR